MNSNSFFNHLIEEEKRLISALEAVRLLKQNYALLQYNSDKNESAIQSINPISENKITYDIEWSQKEKVKYALKLIGRGVVDEVAEKLNEIDSTINLDNAKRICTTKLSQLYRDKEIDAKKVGKKYRYYAE
tara:strand:- start:4141 stop:4533 length:393 start_codon:yes stop_codon:yes gene_type:complete